MISNKKDDQKYYDKDNHFFKLPPLNFAKSHSKNKIKKDLDNLIGYKLETELDYRLLKGVFNFYNNREYSKNNQDQVDIEILDITDRDSESHIDQVSPSIS